METRMKVKVYYEDTDCLGIVYHANYLKYLERGRTEYFNETGKNIQDWNKQGYNFAVYQMQIKFKKAAKLGDTCDIITKQAEGGSEYRKKMEQKIEINGDIITEAVVDIVCLNEKLELREFPKGIFK